jgi:hypothetical protein
MNNAGLGGGAAHIEGDRAADAGRVAQHVGADHAGSGSRLQHADAGALRIGRIEQSAGGLHDEKIAGEAGLAQMSLHLSEITPHARADIGVGRNGRSALELPVFLRQFVRGGDKKLRVFGLAMICFTRRSWAGLRYECRNRIATASMPSFTASATMART